MKEPMFELAAMLFLKGFGYGATNEETFFDKNDVFCNLQQGPRIRTR
jgi:hypothetical protein